jgi:hypothetical protein
MNGGIMLKKTLLILIAVTFMCVPAMAGERPEFDAVGDDAAIYFTDIAKALVLANNPWNADSDFTAWPPEDPYEFWNGPGGVDPDLCFPGYFSRLVPAGFAGGLGFAWRIVLQLKPDTDLDINIIDCVVKPNSNTAFGINPNEGAHQTGRYLLMGFLPYFDVTMNPIIRARALAGPNAAGVWDWFYLTARTHPLLRNVVLDGARTYFTSKGIWDESIVVRLPEPMLPVDGHPGMFESALQQGDMFEIEFQMPAQNPVDIRYGQYSVFVKYVGVTGTDWTLTDAM